MTDRSDLTRMIREASTGAEQARAVAALDSFDRQRADAISAGRELDLGARIASARLEPVPLHEHHTAATDWLAEVPVPDGDGYRTAMIAEASRWYRSLDPQVRSDAAEISEQARGRARTLASAYAPRSAAAEREFLQVVSYLRSADGASGLPQVDQTIDANNAPAPTPYPTQVFPTFFPGDVDEMNQVEMPDHQSGAASTQAPLIQQVMQQENGGSGYGTGPEKPDSHTIGFDPSGGYAEVPLGAPGQIPTAPAAADSMASSAPNPVAGVPQDAGAGRRTAAAVEGYSMPDPHGYRWAMMPEVMHPFHERCASAHWPDEACGNRSHTASVAVGYLMDIDRARRTASCEATGAREGLRAVAASASPQELGEAHNRFTAAWGTSERGDDDSAVLHGFMAVVRPVLADLAHEAAMSCAACKGGDCASCSGSDCGCARHGKKASLREGPRAKIAAHVAAMSREYGQAGASR